ncbi:hypothetical protein ABZ851_11425 [Streptomyces sp. NPDC047049]|uniref:hypothetical protein n=1 Tax=Streptomyces sp. NPDC047049 TaxID=3156688 RepID=UPI0033D52D6A
MRSGLASHRWERTTAREFCGPFAGFVTGWSHWAASCMAEVTAVGHSFVVLTAALSACNSGIHSAGRMVRGLALNGEAPRAMAGLSDRHLPLPAVVLSTLVMGAGIAVNVVSPDKAFVYITSVSACAGLWTWSMILISHLRYRCRVRAGLLPAVGFRMPGAPVTHWTVLAALAFVVVLMTASPETRPGPYVWAVWFTALTVVYGLVIKRGVQQRS